MWSFDHIFVANGWASRGWRIVAQRRPPYVASLVQLALGLAFCALFFAVRDGRHDARASLTAGYGDIHRIKHVIVIMQENRSFDSYFGTYPGVVESAHTSLHGVGMGGDVLADRRPDELQT